VFSEAERAADAARASRLYPTMDSAVQTRGAQTDPATRGAVEAKAPASAEVMPMPPTVPAAAAPSHWNDQAARMYRTSEAPDPVAQKAREAADAAEKARQTAARELEAATPKALTESLPANIAKLRESAPLVYAATYDEAMGLRTKDFIEITTQDGDVVCAATPELALVRNAVAGMAHDAGLNPDDLRTIVNQIGTPVDLTDTASHADLTDAFTLASRDPRMTALLDKLHLTTNPVVVRILAAAAREQRSRGRL